METYLLRVFQRQIEAQCVAAIMAAEQANATLHAKPQDRFWASIQNCLTAVANISKACWGQ